MELSDNTIKIFCDGGSRGNPGIGASAFVVYINNKIIFKDGIFLSHSTNNTAEYTGVIIALKWLRNYKVEKNVVINFYLDSELVVKQINGLYKIKNDNLKNLFSEVYMQKKEIENEIKFINISRKMNYMADYMVNKIIDENI